MAEQTRPPNVPPEASGGAGGQWVLYRGDEMFLWAGPEGTLVEHKQGDLETRWDKHGRRASHGPWATLADGRSRRPHGVWEYGYEGSELERESVWELGVEKSRRWFQHGLERAGAIAQVHAFHPIDVEVGTWRVLDGETGNVVQTFELGPAFSDDELYASPAMRDQTIDPGELADLAGDRPVDAPSLCAWIRLAGRLDAAVLARVPVRPERWGFIPHSFTWWHDGDVEELRGGTLATRLQSVFWGVPWAGVIEAAGEFLLERGRPYAALDFLDAAGALRGSPCAARAGALVALGRESEAELLYPLFAAEARATRELAEAIRADGRSGGDTARKRTACRALADVLDVVDDADDELADGVVARIELLRAYADTAPPPAGALERLVAGFPERMTDTLTYAELGRGFADPAAIRIDADSFLKHANDLVRLFPCTDQLDLEYASRAIGRVMTCSGLARYRVVRLWDTYLFDGGAAHVAASRYLEQVEELGLFNTSLSDEDLVPILQSQRLGKLLDLDIGHSREGQSYTLDGVRPIADSIFAKQLQSLSMARMYFEADVIPDVVAVLPALTDLNLEGMHLQEGGAEALAGLPHRFFAIDLERCGLDAAAMRHLANSPILERCHSLQLRGNPLGPNGFLELAMSPHLGQLASLDVGGSDSRPDADFIEALGMGLIAPTLQSLTLTLGGIGPRGATLLAAGAWPQLSRLELYGNKIRDEGAVALANSPVLSTIAYLDLGDNELSDDAAFAFAASPHAHPTLWLEFGGATLSPAASAALVARFGDRVKLTYPWGRRG